MPPEVEISYEGDNVGTNSLNNQKPFEEPSVTVNKLNDALPVFYPELKQYLTEASKRFDTIPSDRKAELSKVADFIRERLSKLEPAKLTFICTHNSRRSHLSQIWAQVAADYYCLDNVETYSGGTEATAFNPRAVAAMQRCGLRIVADDPTATNPLYSVYTSASSTPQVCFSKAYGDPPNPSKGK